MPYPLIIASTMGMFDKFPVNNSAQSYKGRYHYSYYHYVGPKANSNLFASKANVLLQQLSSLSSVNSRCQLEMIDTILGFIGYDSRIEFTFTPQKLSEKHPRLRQIDHEYLALLDGIWNDDCCLIQIRPLEDNLKKIRSIPLSAVYHLRQAGLLRNLKCYLFKHGERVDCSYLSSGEFNLLCIVLSVILSIDSRHLLILLDEPEISQHPNWQLDLIPNLEKALVDFGCHFIIATHCHFLVSNLPLQRSNVICMSRTDNDIITAESIPSETNGWSAEEVLLRVFNVPTDRNRYLAQMVNDFLQRIGDKSIERHEANKAVEFFREISGHLNIYDPMKKVLDIIVKEYAS